MEWLKGALATRREMERQRQYRRGFEWAMGAYYIEKKSIEEIEALAYPVACIPGVFFDNCGPTNDSFDRGAVEAVRIIEGGTN